MQVRQAVRKNILHCDARTESRRRPVQAFTMATLMWLVWLVIIQALALMATVLPSGKRGGQAKALDTKTRH